MNFWQFLQGLFVPRTGGGTVVTDTIEVFRPNAEKAAERIALHQTAALAQYRAEFHDRTNRNWIDAVADGMNRLVRPVVSFGLLAPIFATIWAPDKMSKVWIAISTLPPGYWAVVGIVLPFYFGGRMQVKALDAAGWQAAALATSQLVDDEMRSDATGQADGNAALSDWGRSQRP